MKSHQVHVTIRNGAIQVQPDSLVMTRADDMQWVGTGGAKFSIEFDDEGPFGRRALPHAVAITRMKPSRNGRFKYTVISDADPGLRLDPDIIVDDPPTGGP